MALRASRVPPAARQASLKPPAEGGEKKKDGEVTRSEWVLKVPPSWPAGQGEAACRRRRRIERRVVRSRQAKIMTAFRASRVFPAAVGRQAWSRLQRRRKGRRTDEMMRAESVLKVAPSWPAGKLEAASISGRSREGAPGLGRCTDAALEGQLSLACTHFCNTLYCNATAIQRDHAYSYPKTRLVRERDAHLVKSLSHLRTCVGPACTPNAGIIVHGRGVHLGAYLGIIMHGCGSTPGLLCMAVNYISQLQCLVCPLAHLQNSTSIALFTGLTGSATHIFQCPGAQGGSLRAANAHDILDAVDAQDDRVEDKQ
eukprot:1161755-Pelagomonas_calceolata.AAC.2